jgi:hypothetical protein
MQGFRDICEFFLSVGKFHNVTSRSLVIKEFRVIFLEHLRADFGRTRIQVVNHWRPWAFGGKLPNGGLYHIFKLLI